MAAPEAVGTVAVARSEVRKSLDRLDYHLGRGAKGAKGVRREIAYLDALHRQTVRNASQAVGLGNYAARPIESFGTKAAEALRSGSGRTVGRMKSSVLADFSADGLQPARVMAGTPALESWTWQANASACPTCLTKHGQIYTGPFVPSHPSCLCIPAQSAVAKAYGVEPLSQTQVREAIEQWGDPRYLRLFEKMDNGLIDFSDIAKIEDVNSHTKGLQAFREHLAKNEITLGDLPPLSSQELAQTFPYGSPTTAAVPEPVAPQAPLPSGTTSKASKLDWPDDDAVRTGFAEREAIVKHSDDWWSGMTIEEREAVTQYSQSYFTWENDYRIARARGLSQQEALDAVRDRAPSSYLTAYNNAKDVDDALLRLHRNLEKGMNYGDDLDDPIITHRRMRRSEGTDQFVNDLEAALVSGEKVTHVPYASTTIDPSFSLSAGSDLYYHLEFLTKSGRFLGYHSSFPAELEFLIRGGTEFRVRGKKVVRYLRATDNDLAYMTRKADEAGEGLLWSGQGELDLMKALRDAKAKGVDINDYGAVRAHIDDMLRGLPDEQIDKYLVAETDVYQLEEVF